MKERMLCNSRWREILLDGIGEDREERAITQRLILNPKFMNQYDLFYIEAEKECFVCKNTEKIKIHHIIRIVDYGEHSKDNVVLLCKKCHNKMHTNNSKINLGLSGKENTEFKNRTLELKKEGIGKEILEKQFEEIKKRMWNNEK